MKRATISHTKNHLSALLEEVRAGETILILDRDRPVAQLVPVRAAEARQDERIAALERQGLIARPRRRLTRELLESLPPAPAVEVDAVSMLVSDRKDRV